MDRIEALRAMLRENPDDALGHYLLASELFTLGRHRECIEALMTYLSLAEDEGAAYRTLAQCHEVLGEIAEARRAYEAGIRQAEKHHHPGMAEEFRDRLRELAASNG